MIQTSLTLAKETRFHHRGEGILSRTLGHIEPFGYLQCMDGEVFLPSICHYMDSGQADFDITIKVRGTVHQVSQTLAQQAIA